LINKRDIIKKYNLGSKESFIVKILDKVEQVNRKNLILNTDFLDPFSQSIIKEIIDKYYEISYELFGGYNDSERKILVLFPNYIESIKFDIPIKIINIEGIQNPNHRNVLGSILALGLNRDKIGDIIICTNLVQVVVSDDIADYIAFNLLKIGNKNVSCSVSSIEDIITPKKNIKLLSTTVPSLRLDAVSAAGFNESRSIVASNIKGNKVSINHRPVNSISHILEEGDIISYRGKGRIELHEILGTTRKERIKIVIKKYL